MAAPKRVSPPTAPAAVEPEGCPDGGFCHHECEPGACFRVHSCGPLSGTYPGDTWPAEVRAAWADGGVL